MGDGEKARGCRGAWLKGVEHGGGAPVRRRRGLLALRWLLFFEFGELAADAIGIDLGVLDGFVDADGLGPEVVGAVRVGLFVEHAEVE
jgi:hypothetical protein